MLARFQQALSAPGSRRVSRCDDGPPSQLGSFKLSGLLPWGKKTQDGDGPSAAASRGVSVPTSAVPSACATPRGDRGSPRQLAGGQGPQLQVAVGAAAAGGSEPSSPSQAALGGANGGSSASGGGAGGGSKAPSPRASGSPRQSGSPRVSESPRASSPVPILPRSAAASRRRTSLTEMLMRRSMEDAMAGLAASQHSGSLHSSMHSGSLHASMHGGSQQPSVHGGSLQPSTQVSGSVAFAAASGEGVDGARLQAPAFKLYVWRLIMVQSAFQTSLANSLLAAAASLLLRPVHSLCNAMRNNTARRLFPRGRANPAI